MGSNPEDWRELLFWWAASLFAATTVVVARLSLKLYGAATDFPEEPVLALHWRRRQYVALAELAALPAFATISVVLVSYQQLYPVAAVLLSLAQGFVGFPLLLDGAAFALSRAWHHTCHIEVIRQEGGK